MGLSKNVVAFWGVDDFQTQPYGGVLKWGYTQNHHIHFMFRFSTINHPFWGTSSYGNPQVPNDAAAEAKWAAKWDWAFGAGN